MQNQQQKFSAQRTNGSGPGTKVGQFLHEMITIVVGVQTSFSMTFNAGSTADVQCPEEMADESDPTAGGTVRGYIEYYSHSGALLADC